MATWKKLVVSGSNISQLNNDSGYISASQVPAAGNSFSTASFLSTELLANDSQGNLTFASSSGAGLLMTANAGTDTLNFSLSAVPNSSLANDGITFGGDDVSLGDTVTQLNITGYTGSFTGSIADGTTATTQTAGDNSTKVATTAYVDNQISQEDLDFSGDSGTGAVDLDSQTFTIAGGAGITTAGANQTLTVTANVDDSTIEIATDSLQVKDSGITNAKLQNSTITLGTTVVNLGDTVTRLQTITDATGSFTGSFTGDGSGLTGIATTLNLTDGSNAQAVNLLTETLTFSGTANEVEVSTATADTVTIGLPDDVTIGQDLTVTRDATISRNLTVLGTASFQHTEDLDVADRFIRLASGSTSTGDGGIVIQQTGATDGECFGFDAATTRFGVDASFDASQNAFTPDAFMAAAINTNGNDPNGTNDPGARYNKKGNLYVAGDSEDIWIYS